MHPRFFSSFSRTEQCDIIKNRHISSQRERLIEIELEVLRLCTEKKLRELKAARKEKAGTIKKIHNNSNNGSTPAPQLPLEVIDQILAQLCFADIDAGVCQLWEQDYPRPVDSFCTLRLLASPSIGADWKDIILRNIPLLIELVHDRSRLMDSPISQKLHTMCTRTKLLRNEDSINTDSISPLLRDREIEIGDFWCSPDENPSFHCLKSIQQLRLTSLFLRVKGPRQLLSALQSCGPAVNHLKKLTINPLDWDWEVDESDLCCFDDISAPVLKTIMTPLCVLACCIRLSPNVQALSIWANGSIIPGDVIYWQHFRSMLPTSLTRLDIMDACNTFRNAFDGKYESSEKEMQFSHTILFDIVGSNTINLPNLLHLEITELSLQFVTEILLHFKCEVLRRLRVKLPPKDWGCASEDKHGFEFISVLGDSFSSIKSLEVNHNGKQHVTVSL